MKKSHLRPLVGSLPYVLLVAIAAACSATDGSSSSRKFNGEQLPERASDADADADTDSDSETDRESEGGASSTKPGTFASDSDNSDNSNSNSNSNADNSGNSGNSNSNSNDNDNDNDNEPDASDARDKQTDVNGANGNQVDAATDSDGDGLLDSVETNTHVFVGRNNTGTDPRNWDTDGDGISDGDEVLGTAAGLNLPAMGVNPLRKNILLEYDWFDDNNENSSTCPSHSHRPTTSALSDVSKTFAAAPVSNPDGSTGITVIHDYGQGGVFTGGNRIADSDGVLSGGVGGNDFMAYRAQYFASNRQGYFHYTILPHRYDTNSDSSGQADLPGENLIVSLYCFNSDYNVASTIVHELGHNLGLRHGGNVDTNHKPNYNSVMNYDYQFTGVDIDCKPAGDHVIDYSRNTRLVLDERALDERKGTCGTAWWDWNKNKSSDAQVSVDINGDSTLGVLTDYDDWSALVYDWDGRAGNLVKRSFISKEIATCDSHPPHN